MPKRSLRERLLNGVYVVPRGSAHIYLQNGQYSSETFRGEDAPVPTIAVDDKLNPRQREKMIFGESLHFLKDADPVRHNRLYQKAIKDKQYMEWARRSYARAQVTEGEKRSFAKWHRLSRFDQVLGGYIQAGDPDLPTMANWNRDELPIGRGLRTEFEKLRKDLDH